MLLTPGCNFNATKGFYDTELNLHWLFGIGGFNSGNKGCFTCGSTPR